MLTRGEDVPAFAEAAYQSSLYSATRRTRRAWGLMPWERGPVLGTSVPLPRPFAMPVGPMPLMPVGGDAVSNEEEGEHPKPAALFELASKFVRRHETVAWETRLAGARSAAIHKWLGLIKLDPMCFDVARAYMAGLHTQQQNGSLTQTLVNAFATKSSATLSARAGPILRYAKFWVDMQGAPFPFTEAKVYHFMECVESSAAPTFFRSLVGSIAFAWYTLGAAGGDFGVKSTRITGFASRLYVTKRLSIQRPPLLVCQIQRLENIVNGNIRKAARDRVAAGFFLFATLARARFSDAMAVEKLELDMTQAGDGFGYVEAATTRSKTSYTLERKTRYLPLAAPAVCLCEGSWARSWIQLMEKTGLQVGKGKPLLPAPGIGGEWSPVPLTASEGAGWLRSLLQVEGTRAEYEQLKKIGTHSCKTTVLSWAAKYGTPHELRLTMGYHSLGAKSKSMYVYGRDNISEALRKEDELLAEIRASRFLPDATRSGYFPGREPAEANKIESEPTSAELRDASSSECSADEEVCQNVDVEEAEEEIAGDWHVGFNLDELPDDNYFRHVHTRYIHLNDSEEGARFVCGRHINNMCSRVASRPKLMHPACKQCFAKFQIS